MKVARYGGRESGLRPVLHNVTVARYGLKEVCATACEDGKVGGMELGVVEERGGCVQSDDVGSEICTRRRSIRRPGSFLRELREAPSGAQWELPA